MRFGITILAFSALAGSSWAQLGGLQGRGGYFWGNRFTGDSGSISLNGLSVGLDYTVYKDPLGSFELRVSPEAMFGGITAKGGDDDADVYRLLATAKIDTPGYGFYGIAGVGYGWVSDRGQTDVGRDTGTMFKLGVGQLLGRPSPIGPKTFVEASYYYGNAPFRGFAVEFWVKF